MRAPQYAAVEKEFARGGSLKAALAKNMPPPAAAAAGAAGAAVQKRDAPAAAAAAAAVGGTGAQGDGAKVQKGGGLLKRFMGGGSGGSQGSDLSKGREERAKTRVREKNEATNSAQRAADAAVVQHGQRWPGLIYACACACACACIHIYAYKQYIHICIIKVAWPGPVEGSHPPLQKPARLLSAGLG